MQNQGISQEKSGLYSTSQIAQALNVSRITIFRYIKEGKLKAIKQGRAYRISETAYYEFKHQYLLTEAQGTILKPMLREMVLEVYQILKDTPPEDLPDIPDIVSKN